MTTHAHRPGEFGNVVRNAAERALRKDPAYQAKRAQHWAKVARQADVGHSQATTRADVARNLLAGEHAERKAAFHARAAAARRAIASLAVFVVSCAEAARAA